MENNLTSLEANIRETKTKSDIKKLRIDGFVPGVLYGCLLYTSDAADE